jgi:hypothetical protein
MNRYRILPHVMGALWKGVGRPTETGRPAFHRF